MIAATPHMLMGSLDCTAPVRWLMGLLIVTDVALLGIYVGVEALEHSGRIEVAPRILDIGFDYSLSEYLNQAKWVSIGILLLILWMRSGMATALSFAIVFATVAADDIFRLHETVGALLVESLGLGAIAGLRAHDSGELLVWSFFGIIVVVAIALGFRRADAAGQRVGWTMILFLGVLIVFAVGFDMLQIVFWEVGGVKQVLGLVEDGGEMIVGSICVAYCAALTVRTSPRDGPDRRSRPKPLR